MKEFAITNGKLVINGHLEKKVKSISEAKTVAESVSAYDVKYKEPTFFGKEKYFGDSDAYEKYSELMRKRQERQSQVSCEKAFETSTFSNGAVDLSQSF